MVMRKRAPRDEANPFEGETDEMTENFQHMDNIMTVLKVGRKLVAAAKKLGLTLTKEEENAASTINELHNRIFLAERDAHNKRET